MKSFLSKLGLVVFFSVLLVKNPLPVYADGFQLNRYEPTAAGEWNMLVEQPWYSHSFWLRRDFSAGVTFNYGWQTLPSYFRDASGNLTKGPNIIDHQLLAHVNVAGSVLDRFLISASLPVTLFEGGTDSFGISPSGVAAGDPRLGLMIRLIGQPYRSVFSLSVGGYLWIPVNSYTNTFAPQIGDVGLRGGPQLVASGMFHHLQWSVTGAWFYRPDSTLGMAGTGPLGNFQVPISGSELQFGAAVKYADLERRFNIGPEALFSTIVSGDQIGQIETMSFEAILAAHYNIKGYVDVGLAGGIGVLNQAGTPGARALFTVAYAPLRQPKPVSINSNL